MLWRYLSSSQRPDWLWGPPSLLSNGTGVPSSGVKRPEIEAEYSLHPVPRL
jgi:hypothetical protein